MTKMRALVRMDEDELCKNILWYQETDDKTFFHEELQGDKDLNSRGKTFSIDKIKST